MKNVTADFLSRHPTDAVIFENDRFVSTDKEFICNKCKCDANEMSNENIIKDNSKLENKKTESVNESKCDESLNDSIPEKHVITDNELHKKRRKKGIHL